MLDVVQKLKWVCSPMQNIALTSSAVMKGLCNTLQGGPKKLTALRVNNFVTVSVKKVCDMSKVSIFCLKNV